MEPGLYLVGTPIGHLQDITLRALETLREASLIRAEDTRETRKLLERHGLRTPMMSYHKFNEAARVEEVLNRLRGGAAIALVTDAGMPGVSDPGARVVSACREAGLAVRVVPGPSAVTSAVALAGFASGGFVFGGFLPPKPGARRRRLAELGRSDLPLVLFESPYRLLRLADDVEAMLGPRRMVVARELTKHFEEVIAGVPADIRASFAKRAVKGEIVVIIEPGDGREIPPASEPSDEIAEEDDPHAATLDTPFCGC